MQPATSIQIQPLRPAYAGCMHIDVRYMKYPSYIFILFSAMLGIGAVSARGVFDNPIELFSGALIPCLSHSEKATVTTTLRGFYLRADIPSGMRSEYEPSEAGLYLDASVRDPEEIPAFKDVTTTKGPITTRTVEIPAPKGEEVALRITLEYGKDAPIESLTAIRTSIAKTIKTSEQVGGGNAPKQPSHPATAPSKSRATP